jgi:hypothetical protein
MTQKPCACFGYILIQNTYQKDSVYEVQTSSDSNTTLFLTKGHILFRDKQTGEVLNEHFPGEFGSDWETNLTEAVAVEESVFFCLTPKLNRGYVPETMPVVLDVDGTATYDAGTKFFLCQGTIKVNGSELTGPYQVEFKGAQTVTAKTDVYGIIVK